MLLFDLGKIVLTNGVNELCEGDQEFDWFIQDCLGDFVHGNFGCLDEEDKKANLKAIEKGGTIYGQYKYGDVEIWIITEWDRSVTTILLPEEY